MSLTIFFWWLVDFSICRFYICYNLFSIVQVWYCWFTWQNLFFHRVIKSTFPNVDSLLRSSTDEIITFSTKLCIVRMGFQCVLKLPLLRIPDFGLTIIRRRNQVRTMWMKINRFYWSFVSFVNLNHMLRS